jgi:hypothetical protein
MSHVGVVPSLARQESRRLLRHPVLLAGFAWWVVIVAAAELYQDTFVVQRFESVTSAFSFLPGVPCILAGHMIATRDARAGSLPLLGALPVRAEQRVRALCLAALAPAAVAALLNAGLFLWYDLAFGFPDAPDAWQVLQAPLTVAGGTLLGVMLGVWAPSRATPMLAMVVMVGLNVVVANRPHPVPLFGPMFSWADWGPTDGTVWWAMFSGSTPAHFLYLCGLCSMAAAAALIRVSPRRGRALAVGACTVAVTVAAGWAQLP